MWGYTYCLLISQGHTHTHTHSHLSQKAAMLFFFPLVLIKELHMRTGMINCKLPCHAQNMFASLCILYCPILPLTQGQGEGTKLGQELGEESDWFVQGAHMAAFDNQSRNQRKQEGKRSRTTGRGGPAWW